MTDLERFHACMNYQEVDHAPFWTWGEWPETIERWEREGYDKDNFDLNMGADIRQTPGGWFDPNPPLANEILDETEEYILYSDDDGIVKREMKNNPLSSMPQFVKFPVETRAEFRKFWKERMQPDLAKRIGPDWKTHLQSIRERPIPLNIIAGLWGGFFGPLRNLVGVEKLCTLFCDDPVFLEEMMDADADFLIAMMTQVLEVVTIDAFIFWEDMAYKTAPLISPNMVR
ncbi:MAG: hypothetical protein QF473_24180, partial [Planctomycetota bacterium]|nr:hypothetical protein [Planctomycetota bacterium]